MVFEAWHNNIPIPVLNFIHRYTPNARWMALRKRRFEMHAIMRKHLDAKKIKLNAGRDNNPEWEKKDMLTMLCTWTDNLCLLHLFILISVSSKSSDFWGQVKAIARRGNCRDRRVSLFYTDSLTILKIRDLARPSSAVMEQLPLL